MTTKTDYEKDYWFSIDDYLIANYPTMTMRIRCAVCALALQVIDSESIEDIIDACVVDYALNKMNLQKLEEEEEEDQ
jgi:hypothetical protein